MRGYHVTWDMHCDEIERAGWGEEEFAEALKVEARRWYGDAEVDFLADDEVSAILSLGDYDDEFLSGGPYEVAEARRAMIDAAEYGYRALEGTDRAVGWAVTMFRRYGRQLAGMGGPWAEVGRAILSDVRAEACAELSSAVAV